MGYFVYYLFPNSKLVLQNNLNKDINCKNFILELKMSLRVRILLTLDFQN